MIKMGKLRNPQQQLYLLHGLYLAIIDVVYKKIVENEVQIELTIVSDSEEEWSVDNLINV